MADPSRWEIPELSDKERTDFMDALEPPKIQLDPLTEMMLRHLREHQDEEPQVPSPDDDRYAHEEKAALHYEWSRAHQAIRLLIGVQLVNLAVEQVK